MDRYECFIVMHAFKTLSESMTIILCAEDFLQQKQVIARTRH